MAKTFRRDDEPENDNFFNKLFVVAKRQHIFNKITDVGRNRFEHKLQQFKKSLDDVLLPHNNRRVCAGCGRSKQLFNTEEEALNFIRFNGDKFEHQNELRVYWCKSCAAYHYSSKPSKNGYVNRTKRLIEASNSKTNGVFSKLKAETIWRDMDWEVRALPKPAFDKYCEERLHLKLTSSVYLNGLSKLYNAFHSAA